jgi:uncharacterized protein YabE (DUF348 family)
MKSITKKSSMPVAIVFSMICFLLGVFGVMIISSYAANASSPKLSAGQRLITIHDSGHDKGIITHATTLRYAFEESGIQIDPNDTVEPGLDEELIANNYEVNIYRARPVTIVDGNVRQKVMSPYQTAKQIAKQANIILHDEDTTTITASTDMVSQGSGVQMIVDRATPVTLVLYGTKNTAYTQKTTVADMLKEKNITIGNDDTLSVSKDAAIASGMTIELWRNGKQTATEKQDIDFEVEQIQDANREVGYKNITTPGVKGKKTVTYEIVMKNGKEESRKEIQSVVIEKAQKQVETVGIKVASGAGLTKGKGVYNFTDSKGIVHRETYYDLPMSVVMGVCGGSYSVRSSDGVKVDQDGYIIVAANLGRYSRCSVVETSLGLGKVYDTGDFASRHPDGFDLATDWSNWDGR